MTELIHHFEENIQAQNLTQTIIPVAKGMVLVIMAARILGGMTKGGGSFIEPALLGCLALGLITALASSGTMKEASYGAWQTTYRSVDKGTELTNKIFDSTGLFETKVDELLNKIFDSTPAATMGTAGINGATLRDLDSQETIKSKTEELAKIAAGLKALKLALNGAKGPLKILSAVIIPVMSSYITANALLGVASLCLGIAGPLALAAIALGSFQPLVGWVSAVIGIIAATAVMPSLMGAAVDMAIGLPLNAVAKGFGDMSSALATPTNPLDLVAALGKIIEVSNIVMTVLVIIVACVFAAASFMKEVPKIAQSIFSKGG